MLSLPTEPWITGWKALVAIEPPLEGPAPLESAGAVCVWSDLAAAEAVKAVAQLCEAHFSDANCRIFQVAEHRRKAPERTWEPGEATPGFVRLSFMRRLAGISPEEFAQRWCEGHWPLVAKHHPGLSGYTQNVVQATLGEAEPAWDGLAELQFATAADMRDRMYDSEAGKQIIWDDIAGFLDAAAGSRLYAQETWLKHPDG